MSKKEIIAPDTTEAAITDAVQPVMAQVTQMEASDATQPVQIPGWATVVSRQPELNRVLAEVPLDKISLQDAEIKGFRPGKDYSDDALETLKQSINADGKLAIINPPHVYLDPVNDRVSAMAGLRRLHAAGMLARPDKDGKRIIAANTPVMVFIYLTTSRLEMLKTAVTDNSFRKEFGNLERYRASVAMHKAGLQSVLIASTMGESKDTVERFLVIAKYGFLDEFLMQDWLPYTKLSQIGIRLQKQGKAELTAATEQTLRDWKDTAEEEMKTFKANCKRKNKKVPGNKRDLAGYLLPEIYRGWLEDLENGVAPTGEPKSSLVTIKIDKTEVNIGGFKRKLDDLDPDDLADTITMYEAAIPDLNALLDKLLRGNLEAKDYRDTEIYQKRKKQLLANHTPRPRRLREADDDPNAPGWNKGAGFEGDDDDNGAAGEEAEQENGGTNGNDADVTP